MNKKLEAYLEQCMVGYQGGTPLIPDDVYDRLVENTSFESIIGLIEVGEQRYNHAFPMYSLQKVFLGEDKAPDWGNAAHIMTSKLDGTAVSLTYIDNELHQALTRGDGKQGIDITDKMRFLVPKFIKLDGLVQITGEVVAPKEIPNARNYASGSLNLKDIEEFKTRDLTFIAYGVQPYPTDSWTQDLALLDLSGFETVIQSDYACFPHDGKVVRVVSNKVFEQLGYTSHHPRGSYALKTRQKGVVTRLLDVEWNVGKSGAVSPVAILEPCTIGEATVSRATLHNMAYIDALDLEIGCDVEVISSGEIIPRIVKRV